MYLSLYSLDEHEVYLPLWCDGIGTVGGVIIYCSTRGYQGYCVRARMLHVCAGACVWVHVGACVCVEVHVCVWRCICLRGAFPSNNWLSTYKGTALVVCQDTSLFSKYSSAYDMVMLT